MLPSGRGPVKPKLQSLATARREVRLWSRSLPRMPGRRVPEGPPPAPVVQRLRLRYAKRGRLRFSSTRDFQRALERALRRADVPMAFSAGFHPHPRISYANAAPTGTASEAEYVELAVNERVDPEAVRAALDEALPAGLDVLQVVEAGPGSLADRLQASDWVVAVPRVDADELQVAVDAYLAVDRAEVSRTFKTGPRTFDTRVAVLDMRVVDGGDRDGRRAARGAGRRGGVCDNSHGRTAHHTGRTPRRHSDRAACCRGSGAAGATSGDAAGAGSARSRSRGGG